MSASLLVQQLLVVLLVLACALFATWRLLTVRLRVRVLELLERVPALPLPHWRARLRQRALLQLHAACGGCSVKPVAAPRNQTPGVPRR